MDLFIIIVLNVAAIIFYILEIFVFSGMTISAIAGLSCMGYSIYYAFENLGPAAGYTTWVGSGLVALIAIFFFVRSKRLDKFSLKENINSTVDRSAERSVIVGDRGKSITRLALYGRAIINDKDVEVKSAEGFIHENEPIEVIRVSNAEITVKKIS